MCPGVREANWFVVKPEPSTLFFGVIFLVQVPEVLALGEAGFTPEEMNQLFEQRLKLKTLVDWLEVGGAGPLDIAFCVEGLRVLFDEIEDSALQFL